MVKKNIFLEDQYKMFDRCISSISKRRGRRTAVVAIAEPPKNEHELITSINKLVEIIHMLLSVLHLHSLLSRNEII